mgnify:CR=1 FL=1
MTEPNPTDLAEAGYQAYGDFADWTNHAGNAMPSWRELPEPQRCAWVVAAGAIYRALVSPARHGGPRSAYEASHPMMISRSAAHCEGPDDGPQHVKLGDPRAAEPGGRA